MSRLTKVSASLPESFWDCAKLGVKGDALVTPQSCLFSVQEMKQNIEDSRNKMDQQIGAMVDILILLWNENIICIVLYVYTWSSTFWYHIPISTNSLQQNKKSSNHAPLWGGQHLHLKRLFDFTWNFVSLRWWSLWKKALGDVESQIWGSNELFNCIPPGSWI